MFPASEVSLSLFTTIDENSLEFKNSLKLVL